jgi:ubiquinone/menaquinone biosynthesis C-methylase UbiE
MSTDEQSLAWYNNNAKNYTDHVRDPNNSVYHSYYEKPAMYSLLPELQGKTVLSLGCGSGEDSNYLKKAGAEKSVGIDLSVGILKHAKEAYSECEFIEMNMEKLEFNDNTFDFVYSSLAIHYIEDWTQTFKEVFRVLKPNSYFLFSCNHPTSSSMEKKGVEDNTTLTLEVHYNKNTNTVETKGDYFNRRKIIDVLGKNTVNTWHKPLQEIISEAQYAGFIIDRIVEPTPQKALETVSTKAYKELQKIPGFIIFRLLKP